MIFFDLSLESWQNIGPVLYVDLLNLYKYYLEYFVLNLTIIQMYKEGDMTFKEIPASI